MEPTSSGIMGEVPVGMDRGPGMREALRRGIEAVRRGERDAAYEFFREAARLAPGESDAWLWLGATSPDLDQAEAAFSLAYELDPHSVEASLAMRWARLQRGAALKYIVGQAVPVPLEGVGEPELPAEPISAFISTPLVFVEDEPGDEDASSESARPPDRPAPLPARVMATVGALLVLVALFALVGGNFLWGTSQKPSPVSEVDGLEGSGASLSGTQSLLTPQVPLGAPGGTSTPAGTRAATLVILATPNPTSPPTWTITPTRTNTVAPTSTPSPTNTLIPTNTPAPTATATAKPAIPPTPRPRINPAPQVIYYVVRPGDSLFTISIRFHTTIYAIKLANHLTRDAIYAGQTLVIPTGR